MDKTPQIKPVGKLKSTLVEKTEQATGFAVPLLYVENSIVFSEAVATGEMEGRKYTIVLNHDGALAVRIDGVAGQMPEFALKFADLILLAHEAAERHQLLEPIKTEGDE